MDTEKKREFLIQIHQQEYQALYSRGNYFMSIATGTAVIIGTFVVGILSALIGVEDVSYHPYFIWFGIIGFQLLVVLALVMTEQQYLTTVYIEKWLRPQIKNLISNDNAINDGKILMYETFLKKRRTYQATFSQEGSAVKKRSILYVLIQPEFFWYVVPLGFIVVGTMYIINMTEWSWYNLCGMVPNIALCAVNAYFTVSLSKIKMELAEDENLDTPVILT